MAEQVVLTDEQLKKLQDTLLEMITEVDRVCRKNGIQYSLDGGTLLGAVRHKGFIPWDDDADVIFLRSEYERFYEACKTDLDAKRFFLQEYRTDPYYRWGYEKLRRNGTQYLRLGQEDTKSRTGICIDIFVVDSVPDALLWRRLHYFLCRSIRKTMYAELGKDAAPSAFLRAWYRILYTIPRGAIFAARNALAAFCNRFRTELISHMTYPYYERCKYGLPRRCFDDFIDAEFAGHTFRIFKEYDLYLSMLYGDYMTPPPPEARGTHNPVSKIGFAEDEEG